jgi:hypothetical protein
LQNGYLSVEGDGHTNQWWLIIYVAHWPQRQRSLQVETHLPFFGGFAGFGGFTPTIVFRTPSLRPGHVPEFCIA